MNNNYTSILCEYCPYTEFGEISSEYVSGDELMWLVKENVVKKLMNIT